MQKVKSLYNIIIEKCQFNTRLQYNINTNHMVIRTSFQYQDPDYIKEYQDKNKDKIKENKKQYYKQYSKNNKEKIKEKSKQYRINHNLNYTEIGSEEYRIMVSCRKQKIPIKEFNGFVKEKPYCPKFNESCREQNREKYNRKCFICEINEDQNGQRLSVHHVDMNKDQGCDSNWKLVPLCVNCHSRCHNKLWEYRLKYLLKEVNHDKTI